MSPVQPVCLITGASAGIGRALAHEFAKGGHALVLTARREAQLSELAAAIAAAGHPRPTVIAADLAAPGAAAQLIGTLAARGLAPAYLVNSAGFGMLGEAATLDRAAQLAMVDLNIRVLTDITLRSLPSIKRHRGGILNVASLAGFLPGHGMAVYHASKAYVISFTEALHTELKADGVRVCALCPGPVITEFFDRAGLPEDYFPRYTVRSVERVAREGYEGLMGGHRVVVPGTHNRITALLPRLLPHRLTMALTLRRWKRANRGA